MSALPIKGPAAYTEKWHALRIYDPRRKKQPFVIGASKAAVACGASEYQTPLGLFVELRTGFQPDDEDTEARRLGRRLEPVVLDEYELATSSKTERGLPLFIHPEHWFIGATPDAKIVGRDDKGAEAKTTSSHMIDKTGANAAKYGEEGTDQVPVDYFFQAQQQMAVMGWKEVDVPCLVDGRKLRIYRVERNEQVIAAIISAEKELAERVVANDAPEPTWQHEETRALLRQIYGYTPGKKVELTEQAVTYWTAYQKAREQIKALEEDCEEFRNRILAELQDAEAGLYPLGTREVARIVIPDSLWTPADLAEIQRKLGQVKRRGHERLQERKVKQ